MIAAKYDRLAELLSRQSPERQAALIQHLKQTTAEETDSVPTAPGGDDSDD